MPIAKIQLPDGRIGRFEVPDGTTPEQAQSMAEAHMRQASQGPSLSPATQQMAAPPQVRAAPPPDDSLAHPLARLVRGAFFDPVDAGAQLLPRGAQYLTSAGGLAPNPVSDYFGSEARRVDEINKTRNDAFEGARERTGQSGIDAYRLAGNVVSPANRAMATVAPMQAMSTAGRIGQGAVAGGLGAAALSPVNAPSEDFAGVKLRQTGAGIVTGGVLAPILGKVMDFVIAKWAPRWGQAPAAVEAQAAQEATIEVQRAMRESGQNISDLPPAYIQQIQTQVADALKRGQKLDPAAMLRQQDFKALGLPSTQGQLTRDPSQFALERNLRATEQGKDLLSRFDFQNRQLQNMGQKWSEGADTPYQAGQGVIDALKKVDDAAHDTVSNAYGAARDHAGRAAEMDVHTFSTNANAALDSEMLNGVLPPAARDILNDITLGKIPFNVNTATQIDKTLSMMQRGASKAEGYAIGKVRDALNSAPISSGAGVEAKAAFDTARGMHRERMTGLEEAPGLGAVSEGVAAADDFIEKYVLNGRVQELAKMARLLPPETHQQVRAQIGAVLQRGAFGENQAGDKLFSAERFAKTLRQFGEEKLRLFFSAAEIDGMKRAARVGAYINSTPSAAPVMGNPNMGWAADLISRVPGIGDAGRVAVGAVKAGAAAARRDRAIREALSADLPKSAAELSPQARKLLTTLLTSGAVAGGVAGASQIQ
jgi:hypothetical protein